MLRWLGAAWLGGGLAALVWLSIGGPPVVQADAQSTTFDPATVTLAHVGDSATITVRVAGLDLDVAAVQLALRFPTDRLRVDQLACGPVFTQNAGAVLGTFGPAPQPWGVLIGCGAQHTTLTDGVVMTFRLTRTAPGAATITLDGDTAYSTTYARAPQIVNGTPVAWKLPIGAGTLGTLQVLDGSSTTTATTACTGDLNHDGRVDVFDLSALATAFGQTGQNLSADLNGDGVVDVRDLSILAAAHCP